MRAPATFPDEPEPVSRTIHWRCDTTSSVTSFDWPIGQGTFTATTTAAVAGPYTVTVEYR